MLQTNDQTDPIVEILRLAYRRGLAIQREQEENIVINPVTLAEEILTAERERTREIEEDPSALLATQTVSTDEFPI